MDKYEFSHFSDGASASGKPLDFDSSIPRFESWRPKFSPFRRKLENRKSKIESEGDSITRSWGENFLYFRFSSALAINGGRPPLARRPAARSMAV